MVSGHFSIRPLPIHSHPIQYHRRPAWATLVCSQLYKCRKLLSATRAWKSLFLQTLPIAGNFFSFMSQLKSHFLRDCSQDHPVWCVQRSAPNYFLSQPFMAPLWHLSQLPRIFFLYLIFVSLLNPACLECQFQEGRNLTVLFLIVLAELKNFFNVEYGKE